MTLPNKITIVRLILVPILIISYIIPFEFFNINIPSFTVLNTELTMLDVLCFLLFLVASLTDYLDGYLARKRNLITTFGKFIDPIADKLIVNSAILLLASNNRISILIPIIMISRDTIVDAIRLIASQKQVVLAASWLGKLKTATQMIAVCLLLLNNFVFAYFSIPMDQIMIWIATLISVVSGVDYFKKNKHFILESM